MSGAVAYLGDWLGRKVGKKRLTIWGLRPKHSAMIMTILMGVVISIFTILAITASSADVRRWLSEGRAAIHERDVAIEQRDQMKSQISGLDQQIADKSKELTQQRKKIMQQEAEIKKLTPTLAKLRSELTHLNDKNKALSGQYKLVQKDLLAEKAKLTVNKQKLLKSESDLAKVTSELVFGKTQIDEASKQLREIQQSNAELYNTNQQLSRNVSSLQTQEKDLKARLDEVSKQRDAVQTELEGIQTKLDEKQRQYNQLTEQVERMAAEARAYFNSTVIASRTEPLVFKRGEEIARVQLVPNLSQTGAQIAVTTWLRECRIEATARGAKERSSYPVAFLTSEEPSMSTEDIQMLVIRQLIRVPNNQVLIAYSNINAFRGEPVAMSLAVLPNPVVYRKNSVILETVIDGRAPDSAIFKGVRDFIRTQTSNKAEQDRMIPHLNSGKPLVVISDEEILALVQQIKATGRQIRLQATAVTDLRAADDMRLEYRLR